MPAAPADAEERGLGQHVLVDPRAVERLVGAARLRPGDAVADVGAGRGAITAALARAVAPRGRVLAVELDPALASELRARRLEGVEVAEGDALRVPLPRLDAVVANPPFRILAPLALRLLDHGVPRMALVVPREFADRLLARPGQERYGRLTVQMALRASTTPLFAVPRRAFAPPPEVASAAILVEAGPSPGLDLALLDKVLEHAWASKRRTLRHGLAPLAQELRIGSGAVTAALRAGGWEGALPGGLAPDDWAALARALQG